MPAPLIAVVLLALVLGVTILAERRPRLFRRLPPVLAVYALPAVASGAGLIPRVSPLYGALVENLLPASLTLLFLPVQLPAILRLGPLALSTMAVSVLGILSGAIAVQLLLGSLLPERAWSGIAALSASWIGGSVNMVAVKASVGTPEAIFTQAVVVDVTVAYSWMALLMALPGQQARFDRWSRARPALLERLAELAAPTVESRLVPGALGLALALAAAGSALSRLAGMHLPELPGVVARLTWVVLVATALGLSLAATPARRLAERGGTRLGGILLYLVLAAIGAQADLGAVARAPAFVLAGAVWLLLHGALLALLGGRVLRAPLALCATASQACVGGPVSAPIVAAAFRPGLASVGLLLAVLGNVLGTPLGILCGLVCRPLAP